MAITMEELERKAKRYDEVLAMAQECVTYIPDEAVKKYMLNMFPELKESRDEEIRKLLIKLFKSNTNEKFYDVSTQEIVAWLEKQSKESKVEESMREVEEKAEAFAAAHQGENADVILAEMRGEIKPKFHEGDWIISNNKKYIYQVIEVKRGIYVIRDNADNREYHVGIESADRDGRLWTIRDAKDGDVLSYVTDEEDLWIMIYMSLYEPYEGHVHYHALLVNDNFTDKGTCCISINNLKPSTKEQRDTLMKAMNDAGWEFDFEKKELKKIDLNTCSEYERVRKEIKQLIQGMHDTDARKKRWIDWIERANVINIKSLRSWLLKEIAMSVVGFLNKNYKEMHLSNNLCKDIESAVVNEDWDKVYDYIKKLERQGTPKEATYTHEVEVGNGNTKALVTGKIQLTKFKVGQWVINKHGDSWHIDSIDNKNYQVSDGKGNYSYFPIAKQDEMHLWNISDAKDGDVLATWAGAFIYNGKRSGICPGSYCGINTLGKFQIGVETHWTGKLTYPASYQQRELLFQKMKEEGYEWDAEKKELNKLSQQEVTKISDQVKDSDWSEEDVQHIDSLLKRLDGLCRNEFERTRFAINEDEDWLQSLKQRIYERRVI